MLDVIPGVYTDFSSAKRLIDWTDHELGRPHFYPSPRRFLFPLELLVDDSPSPQLQSFTRIERLHTEFDSSDKAFKSLDVTDLLGSDPKLVYIQAPGGSGKSFFLYSLIYQSIQFEVIPFLIDLRKLARLDPNEVKVRLSAGTESALDYLFNSGGRYSGIGGFRKAVEKGRHILLVVDGLNETTVAVDKLVDLIGSIPNNYEKVTVFVADRMAPRDRYPEGYKLATIAPIKENYIKSALENRLAGEQKSGVTVYESLSANTRRILRVPFFLNLLLSTARHK